MGNRLAVAMASAFGYESYVVIVLVCVFAGRIWTEPDGRTLAREAAGGTLVTLALASAVGLWSAGDPVMCGAVGSVAAGVLVSSVNLGGGYIVVGFMMICGLALTFMRAPTDLASAAARGLKAPIARSDVELDDDELFAGDADFPAPDDDKHASGGERRQPLKVRRMAARESAARDRKDKADSKPRNRGAYKLPPLDLLDAPPVEHAQIDESALERSARVLERKLADFGVDGRVVEVQPGPVVTMYKFEPGSGVKVSQIVNLADDLSMALRAATVRIQAPVPGEAVVGIEVPNRKRERVYLREILESSEFASNQSQLTVALGKDIAGSPAAADLARMPHLLIAGATGTGKSVSLHTMISAILFNATADDVRFIMIDPKMLDLSVYENIPHLLVPVVVEPSQAASALLWATQEMESRYLKMREFGVRNIDGYNRMLASKAPVVELKPGNRVPAEGEPEASDPSTTKIEHRKLPKIVIIIDELADLLLSEGKTVERDITRLAQKARAAGIHLILATQRPSVDSMSPAPSSRSRLRRASIPALSSTRSARNDCSARATCCSCRPARPS